MTVISLVSTVLLVACVASGNPISLLKDSRDLYDASILQKKAVSADYEPLGCYITKSIVKRKLFKTVRDKSKLPQVCIQIAMKKNFSMFGILQRKLKRRNRIQYRCLTGEMKNAKTSKKNWRCAGNIIIYKKVQKPAIKLQCNFKNTSYSEGDEVKWYQSSNDTCKACECSGGKFTDCKVHHCDTGLKECSKVYHPPGHCCPACKKTTCEGKNVGDSWYRRGQSWNESNNEDCHYCQCTHGYHLTCSNITCLEFPKNCKKSIIPEDKCCAECVEVEEKVTTKPTTFIINLTTAGTTPPFKFPWER